MSQDILLFTENVTEATREIEANGGRVTQQFTDSVVVANLPDSLTPESLQQSTTVAPSSLDPVSTLAADAWNQNQVRQRTGASRSTTEGLSWDTPGFLPPRHLDTLVDPLERTRGADIEESTGTPTSRYMIGSIAVGVVIVSGAGDLAFSAAEQQQVVREVQQGLNFLASSEPRAKISFVYDIRLITVSAAPGDTDTYEHAEAPWRDAALQQLGFSANRSGSVQYAQNLRATRGAAWSYVAYFTKYPLHHFAYAVDEKLCMNYANDGWGSDLINTVFAHETCHIFGAADEYGDCSCGGSYGQLGVPNNNCVKCTGAHVACLMDANVLQLCPWSRGQIGWDNRLLVDSGDLLWFRHDGRGDGTFRWSSNEGKKVGVGWGVKHVFAGNDGVIYAVMPNDELMWFRHDGRGDGSFKWAFNEGKKVGVGWGVKHVFAGSDGVIYAVMPNDDLMWFRHDGRGDGSFRWAFNEGKKVGVGWGVKHVFAGSDGVIYAVMPNNDLMWFRHDGRGDGSFRWAFNEGKKVGVGWDVRHVFAGSDGVIYAVMPNNDLMWFRHDGRGDGSFRWAFNEGKKVGVGWSGKQVFAGADGVIYTVTG